MPEITRNISFFLFVTSFVMSSSPRPPQRDGAVEAVSPQAVRPQHHRGLRTRVAEEPHPQSNHPEAQDHLRSLQGARGAPGRVLQPEVWARLQVTQIPRNYLLRLQPGRWNHGYVL